jgi:predicted nucleic acid-binding protein
VNFGEPDGPGLRDRRGGNDRLRNAWASNVLAIDDAFAIAWGHLMARRTSPASDGLIAATARVNTLTLVPRNVADFARIGVDVVSPWAA